MKLKSIVIALTVATGALAEDLSQLFEKAYYLETGKGQTENAIALYKSIVASGSVNDEAGIVVQALDRLLIIYNAKDARSIQEKVDSFDPARNTLRDHIVKTFGEPGRYAYMNKEYTADTLPSLGYTMYYEEGFFIQVSAGKIHSIQFDTPIYSIKGLSVGSDKNEVLKTFPPCKVMDYHSPGKKNELGVLYTNYVSNLNFDIYTASNSHCFTFTNGKVTHISIQQYLLDHAKREME